MTELNSYPSLFNLGHRALAPLLGHEVIIEEKVDGSQFSFGLDSDGALSCRSKGKQINLEDPEKMFVKAVESVLAMQDELPRGFIFRGEYLSKPHHNTLTYARVPDKNVIVFDVQQVGEHYLDREDKEALCARLGLEIVPEFFRGALPAAGTEDFLRTFLERTSILGGQKIEGIVLKPLGYNLFGPDKKLIIAKYVSPEFKEVHAATWKLEHGPKTGADIVQLLARQFATPARWQKAVQHLTEAGSATGDLKDIGGLMKEVPEDVKRECRAEIEAALFEWAWPDLKRQLTRGLPEWYKGKLSAEQFAELAKN